MVFDILFQLNYILSLVVCVPVSNWILILIILLIFFDAFFINFGNGIASWFMVFIPFCSFLCSQFCFELTLFFFIFAISWKKNLKLFIASTTVQNPVQKANMFLSKEATNKDQSLKMQMMLSLDKTYSTSTEKIWKKIFFLVIKKVILQ